MSDAASAAPSESVSLVCAATMDWLNAEGVSVRRIAHKSATLRLVRNDLREMFVEVSADKSRPVKLKLAGIVVHKKFMAEGKASIKFSADKCMLMLSNAPPGTLMLFLKTLFVKMTGERADSVGLSEAAVQKNMRAHMLSGASSRFEDISPITQAEITRAQKMAGATSRGNENEVKSYSNGILHIADLIPNRFHNNTIADGEKATPRM